MTCGEKKRRYQRPEFVLTLQQEAGPGRCIFCRRAIGRARGVTCRRDECARQYITTWRGEKLRSRRGEPSLYAREDEDDELAGEFRAEMGAMMQRTSLLISEWCARVDALVADLARQQRGR